MEGSAALIGLDTNVLLRYVLQDEANQHKAAARLVDSLDSSERGFLFRIVLCELIWTLKASYGYSRDDIIATITVLLNIGPLQLEHSEVVRAALEHFKLGSVDFADCLIAALGQDVGCRYTATFDRSASKLPGMRLLA